MTLKKIIITAALFFAAVALGLAAVLWVVNSDRFQQWLIGRVNHAINGRIELGELDISLLMRRIRLSDVRILGVDGARLAAVSRCEISVSLSALVARQLAVTRLAVDGVDLELIFDDQDRLTLAKALSGTASPSAAPAGKARPWQVRLDDIAISNGFVHLHRPSPELDGRLGPLAITGHIDSKMPGGRLAIAIEEAALQWDGRHGRIQDLALDVAYLDSDARPWQVAIETPTSRLSVRGSVQWAGRKSDIDAVAETDLDLAEVQPWLATDFAIQGRLTARMRINGPLQDPRVGLDVDLVKAVVKGIDVESLSVKAVMDQRRIVVDTATGHGSWGSFDARGELDLQAVFPQNLFEKGAGIENLTYSASVAVEDLQPWRLADLPLAWIGTWQGETHLQGQGLPGLAVHRGRGRTDLKVRQIRLAPGGQPVDGTFSAEGHWDQALVDITNCRVAFGDQVLNARGRIDLQRRELVGAKGQLVSDSMASLGRALGIDLPRGNAVVNLSAEGPLTRPMATADLLARDVAMKDFHFGRVLVSATLDSQFNLSLPRLVLENRGSYLEGSGHLALARKDPTVGLDLKFDPLEPSDFGVALPAGTALHGRLTVSGTLKDPLGQLTLDPSPIQWKTLRATLRGQADWQGGRIDVAGLHLSQGESKVGIQGRLDFKDRQSGRWQTDPRIDLKVQSEKVLLEDFWPGRQGSFSAEASFQGQLSNPSGEFTIKGRQLDLQFQSFSRVALTGRIHDRVLYCDELSIALAVGETLQGKGFLALDQTFEFQLNGRNLSLLSIQALQGPYPVRGRLDLTVQGSGSFQNPHISADVAVRDPFLDSQPFDDFQLQAALDGRRLSVDGRMNFDLKADCDLTSGDFSLDARFDDSDLSPWLDLTGDTRWRAVLSGKAVASGNWHAWQAVRVNLSLNHGELSFGEQRLLAIPELNLDFMDGRVHLPETRLTFLDQGYLTLMATGGLTDDLTLKADGRLPVSALAPFMKEPEGLSGWILLKADARGPWDHLQWRVDADLNQVSYLLPYLDQTVQKLNGRIEMTPGQLTLSGISGGIEEGLFTIDGNVRLDDLQPVKGAVALKLDRLPLQVPDTMDLKVSGELALKGAPDKALLKGQLTLLEGLYYKDLRLDLWSILSQTRRSPTAAQVAERPQWLRNISLDVGLSHRYPFLVDNNVAYLEIIPDLKLTGTLARPILSGRATVTEGEVFFRGMPFPVTRGVVDFVNPNKTEPNLDILSETQIRQWLISMSITGPLDQLAVELNSDPPETENNILSLILFGRTNEELSSGSGSGGATTRQMLAGLLASAVGQDIKKTTGVDILEVDTGAREAEDSADRIQVTVGKNLTSRITVKYIVESNNGEMIQRAVSEYRFLEHLLASGFQDSKGKYGGEMLFRLEF